jgi:hypothetical protein
MLRVQTTTSECRSVLLISYTANLTSLGRLPTGGVVDAVVRLEPDSVVLDITMPDLKLGAAKESRPRIESENGVLNGARRLCRRRIGQRRGGSGIEVTHGFGPCDGRS